MQPALLSLLISGTGVRLRHDGRLQIAYTVVHGVQEALNGLQTKYTFNYPTQDGVIAWHGHLPGKFIARARIGVVSTAAVMGPDQAMGQQEAWKAYDRWLEDDRVEFLDEPGGLEAYFRGLTRSPQATPKDWADSYLRAFALASRLTVVTFDQGFQNKGKELLVLKG